MIDCPDLPGRTRPNLRKLHRGLALFSSGVETPHRKYRSPDVLAIADHKLAKKLIKLAFTCADDFWKTGNRHDYRYAEHQAIADLLKLVAYTIRTACEEVPDDVSEERPIDGLDAVGTCEHLIAEILASFSVDEFATLEIGEDSEPQAVA